MKNLLVVEKTLTVLGIFVIAVAFYTTSQMHFINTGYTTLRNGPTASVRNITRAGGMSPKVQGLITDVATTITSILDVDTAKDATLTTTTLSSIKTELSASIFEPSFSVFCSQR